MENRAEHFHELEISKKPRSLDLSSLYKNVDSRPRSKRRARTGGGFDEKKPEKKIKADFSVLNVKTANRNGSKRIEEVYNGCLSPSSHDSKSGLNHNKRCDFFNILKGFNDATANMPRRKRDFVGKKRAKAENCDLGQSKNVNFDNGRLVVRVDDKEKAESSNPPANDGPIDVLVDHVEVNSSKRITGKAEVDYFASEPSEDPPNKSGGEEVSAENSFLNPVKASFRKRSRKRKVVAVSESVTSEFETRDASSTPAVKDLREEEEENLEENAARMLSSRFDPSCTGFTNGKMHLENGNPRKSNSNKKHKKSSGSRAFRRKGHVKEGTSKVRRNYYRIFGDLDPYWSINKRIKVFWPLDRSWYYGHVDNYDKESRLHHVKYDDRDEEWIDLQNERYKLLLLPSEVPGKPDSKCEPSRRHIQPSNKRKRGSSVEQGSHVLNDTDFEPIGTWLSRSNVKIKSPTSKLLQKLKNKGLKESPSSTPPSEETVDSDDEFEGESLGRRSKIGFSVFHSSYERKENYFDDSCTSTQEKKLLVYYRKRFHKKKCTGHSFDGGRIENSHDSPHNVVSRAAFDGFSSNIGRTVPSECSNVNGSLWYCCNHGLIEFNVHLMNSEQLMFRLCLPVSNCTLRYGRSRRFLPMASMARNCTLIAMWPSVELEILFIDNLIGSLYFLFKGTLNQVVTFVCLVLTTFHSEEHKMFTDLRFPGTFIQFKFSCTQDCKKQFVVGFCNFYVIEHFRWQDLYRMFRKNCFRFHEHKTQRISDYQSSKSSFNYTDLEMPESFFRNLSLETSLSNSIVNSSLESEKKCFPVVSVSFTGAPTFFLGLHFRLLLERSVAYLIFHDGAVAENTPLRDSQPLFSETVVDSSSLLVSEVKTNSSLQDDVRDVETCAIETPTGSMVISASDNFPVKLKRIELVQLPSAAETVSRLTYNPEDCLAMVPCDKAQLSIERLTDNTSSELWNMSGSVIPSPNPTARRSTWPRNRNSSSSVGYSCHGWSEVKGGFLQKDLSCGPKKPRTQVSYTSSIGHVEYTTKNRNHSQKRFQRRIRTLNEKRLHDDPKEHERNFDSVCCDANVLVTNGDRGWRESGAQVVLELFDHNEWKLAVKVSGCTKYLHKAHQFLQPGSTNRYTHAMMWKGGKDWVLEFNERAHWALFKEMHEECYHRNIRAASVKNIPIPGVGLLDEHDENGGELQFYRGSKYFCQMENDVEMALNRSRVLYDMDTDDEDWFAKEQNVFGLVSHLPCEVKEDIFEKAMDRLEKAAYSQERDHFNPDEISEFMADLGPLDVMLPIHEHWHEKRKLKKTSLIRHLQPPLWEKYQQEVKEWELALTKNTSVLNGRHEKVAIAEKPAMFAFCLKPRGLELPNKGSKHRSHKKSVTAQHHGEHYAFHSFGRRLNGFNMDDERYHYDPLSPSAYVSSVNDRFERNHSFKLQRNKSKKVISVNNGQMASPYQRYVELDALEFSTLRHLTENPEDLEEYKIRSASKAAEHAANLAKLKREMAQRLLYRADLAIHKAVSALMTAEAMKESLDNVNSSG